MRGQQASKFMLVTLYYLFEQTATKFLMSMKECTKPLNSLYLVGQIGWQINMEGLTCIFQNGTYARTLKCNKASFRRRELKKRRTLFN